MPIGHASMALIRVMIAASTVPLVESMKPKSAKFGGVKFCPGASNLVGHTEPILSPSCLAFPQGAMTGTTSRTP